MKRADDNIVEQGLNFGRLFWRIITRKRMEFLLPPSGGESVDYEYDGQPVQPTDSLHRVCLVADCLIRSRIIGYNSPE